jgi:hypothetical protein
MPVNMMGVGKNDLSEVTHRVFPMKYYTVPQRNYITPSFAAREDFLEYSGVKYGTLRRDLTFVDPVYSPVDGDELSKASWASNRWYPTNKDVAGVSRSFLFYRTSSSAEYVLGHIRVTFEFDVY